MVSVCCVTTGDEDKMWCIWMVSGYSLVDSSQIEHLKLEWMRITPCIYILLFIIHRTAYDIMMHVSFDFLMFVIRLLLAFNYVTHFTVTQFNLYYLIHSYDLQICSIVRNSRLKVAAYMYLLIPCIQVNTTAIGL